MELPYSKANLAGSSLMCSIFYIANLAGAMCSRFDIASLAGAMC